MIFLSYFSMKFLCANRIAPDGTPRSAASHLGLCRLPMSHKKDTRLVRVNVAFFPSVCILYSSSVFKLAGWLPLSYSALFCCILNGKRISTLFYVIYTYIIKIKLGSFKSSEHIKEKGDGPYRGFGYLSLFSDPIYLATWSQRELLLFCIFQQGSRYKD